MSFFLYLTYLALLFLRPFEQFFPELMALRPMAILLVCAFLSAILAQRRAPPSSVPALPVWKLVIGLVISIALSRVFNGGLSSALAALADISPAVMLFLLTMLNLTSLRRIKITCGVIMGCMVLLGLEGIWAYHSGFMVEQLVYRLYVGEPDAVRSKDFAAVPADDLSGLFIYRVRSVGFLGDPNDFAQALLMVLPWMAVLFTPGRWLRSLFRGAVPATILLYALKLTYSRGALVGLGLAGLVWLRDRVGWIRTSLLAGLAGVALIGANAAFGGRSISSNEQSASERIDAWSDGILMFKNSPLFGVGFGNFTEHHIRTAHNSFVLCFAELGITGYFFWIALIVLAYRAVSSVADRAAAGSQERQLALMLRASFAGYIACAWFLSRTYSPTLYILLPMCFALWRCQAGQTSGEVAIARPTWLTGTLALMVASMVAVSVFVRISVM